MVYPKEFSCFVFILVLLILGQTHSKVWGFSDGWCLMLKFVFGVHNILLIQNSSPCKPIKLGMLKVAVSHDTL